MQTIPSKIHKVTIFSDRAQVTRQAEISLQAGEHTLLFDEIPNNIIENSVQVNGKGEASLKQVQIKTAFQKIKLEEDRQKLIKNKKKIEDDLRKLGDNQERLQKEKEFLDQIIQHTTASQSITAPELNPERWEKLFAFQQEKRLQIDEQTFEIEKKQDQLHEKLNEINFSLKNWGTATQKTIKQAEVNLTLNTSATIQLELSYVVRNAGWYPIYDLRVSTETKKMTINYQAIIFQNTQEDWQDVKLQLSTAQPQISGKQPELNPWRLNFYLPPPPAAPMMQAKKRSLAEKAKTSKFGDSLGGMANQMYNVGEVHDGAAEMDWMEQEQERAITMPETKVETKTTAVFFDIAGEHTILSKGTDHRVGITQEEFSAHFRYSTVPKLSPYAYLKTKVVNTTNYPLLKGEAQVFLDNNFVATSHLDTVAPSEEFWTFLGIDEGFKVKHKFVKKYEKQAGGVFAKKTKTLVYEYLITVKSHKKTSEEMVVWDQLPISQNNDIKVELISPTYKADTDKLKKNNLEYLEWFYQMQAGEEVEIPFKFSVEYPQNQSITGLD